MTTFDDLFKREISTEARPLPVGLNKKGEDAVLFVAEFGNEKHEASLRKYNKALANSRHNPKKQALIFAKIAAESVLVSWSGFIDDDGSEIEPTLEARAEMLVECPSMLDAVVEFAGDPANFIDEDDPHPGEVEEDTEKN